MVGTSDVKVYKTTNNLGGAITATQVTSATPNNTFTNVPKNELVIGEDYFACVYYKDGHATETMENFKLWLTSKTAPQDTILKWGFDPTSAASGYRFEPYFTGDGATTFDSTASTAALQIPNWTVAIWFNTTVAGDQMLIAKGGIGSDTAGQNDNYSIRQTSLSKITAGFEEGAGTDHYATSTLSYNDGVWHLAVATYDSSNIKLYIDDMVTPVATTATSAAPETSGTNPVVIGRNSRASDRFWSGFLDEGRVWNVALSQAAREALLNNTATSTGLVYEKKFGADTGVLVAQTIVDKYTSPVDVDWQTLGPEPSTINFGQLKAGKAFPIWMWLHVNANAEARLDDGGLFAFNFNIPQGGTGSPGGGSGGGGSGGSGGNPPPVNADYKVAFAGDWGCASATDSVISLINSQAYNFVVGVGDNAYAGSSCWISRFQALKDAGKLNSAYVNHEYSESGGINPYKTFFGHSLTYFTFKFQNIQFFVFDTNINCDPGSAQHTFISNAIASSLTDSTVTWRIGICHHPWFGSSSSHSYNEAAQVEAFHELFQNNKVSFIVTGHNHNFQRTHQVAYNSADPENPTVVDSTSPFDRNAVGLIHVVSGGGGHDSGSSLYSLGSQPAFQGYQNRTHNGVWEIIASSNAQTLTCQFRETGGDVFDTFTITA